MANIKIGFIGAGKMAEALISGIISAKVAKPDSITVSDRDEKRVKHMTGTYKVKGTSSNVSLAKECDIIVLAVKPGIIDKVLFEIKEFVNDKKLVVSIAAGIKEEFIRKNLLWDIQPQVVRVMPNTPAQVLESASGLYFNENCSDEHREFTKKIFDAVGISVEIEKEELLDAITALSGSGPAYVFFFLEALSDAGVSMGLSREISQKLAIQTVFGAAKMAKETGKHPTLLKEMVTSPGGTTIQALGSLEMDGVKGSIIDAVLSAYERSVELSKD